MFAARQRKKNLVADLEARLKQLEDEKDALQKIAEIRRVRIEELTKQNRILCLRQQMSAGPFAGGIAGVGSTALAGIVGGATGGITGFSEGGSTCEGLSLGTNDLQKAYMSRMLEERAMAARRQVRVLQLLGLVDNAGAVTDDGASTISSSDRNEFYR